MTAEISTALDAFAPRIAARYAALVRELHSEIVAFGYLEAFNSRSYARPLRLLVHPVCTDHAINVVKLEKAANDYAAATVKAWAAKVERKVAGIEGVCVTHMSMDGCRFSIAGTKGGKAVRIEQETILKVSSKGLPFNQFPARIWVDGKFVPEARFEAATA